MIDPPPDDSVSSRSMRVKKIQPRKDMPIKEPRWKRFLGKVQYFFFSASTSSGPTKLAGRIHHKVQSDADSVVMQLRTLREEVEKDENAQLAVPIVSVFDQLLKEIHRLEKGHDSQLTPIQQVKELKDYNRWIEKAKKWIDLGSCRHARKEEVYRAFVDQAIQEFHATIDRDLQVIQDYLGHSIDRLQINDLQKAELQDELEQDLAQHIFELYLLKNHPGDLSWEALNDWRLQADAARGRYFSEALHTIDIAVNEKEPVQVIEEDDEEMAIRMKLITLEDKIIKMEEDIYIYKQEPHQEKKKACLANLEKLESDTHAINGNLLLTYEHVEHAQRLLKTLSTLRELLQ